MQKSLVLRIGQGRALEILAHWRKGSLCKHKDQSLCMQPPYKCQSGLVGFPWSKLGKCAERAHITCSKPPPLLSAHHNFKTVILCFAAAAVERAQPTVVPLGSPT